MSHNVQFLLHQCIKHLYVRCYITAIQCSFICSEPLLSQCMHYLWASVSGLRYLYSGLLWDNQILLAWFWLECDSRAGRAWLTSVSSSARQSWGAPSLRNHVSIRKGLNLASMHNSIFYSYLSWYILILNYHTALHERYLFFLQYGSPWSWKQLNRSNSRLPYE